MPRPTTHLIQTRAGTHWRFEVITRRVPGTADCPGDAVWLRCLGECDRFGRIVDETLAGAVTWVTPLVAGEMRAEEAPMLEAAE